MILRTSPAGFQLTMPSFSFSMKVFVASGCSVFSPALIYASTVTATVCALLTLSCGVISEQEAMQKTDAVARLQNVNKLRVLFVSRVSRVQEDVDRSGTLDIIFVLDFILFSFNVWECRSVLFRTLRIRSIRLCRDILRPRR